MARGPSDQLVGPFEMICTVKRARLFRPGPHCSIGCASSLGGTRRMGFLSCCAHSNWADHNRPRRQFEEEPSSLGCGGIHAVD